MKPLIKASITKLPLGQIARSKQQEKLQPCLLACSSLRLKVVEHFPLNAFLMKPNQRHVLSLKSSYLLIRLPDCLLIVSLSLLNRKVNSSLDHPILDAPPTRCLLLKTSRSLSLRRTRMRDGSPASSRSACQRRCSVPQ